MQKITNLRNGIYCLVIKCSSPSSINCKKFKDILFPAGYYYYVGSAQLNLAKRIERHFRKEKKIHWHIDYLTANDNFDAEEAYIFKTKTKSYECTFSQDLAGKFNLKIIAPEFGNSDCTRCAAHLYYSPKKIPYNHFISRYQSIALFIPSSKETF